MSEGGARRPRVLFDHPQERPTVSLILLDWSCRESFHLLDYLAQQNVPRASFEVVWIEYYDRVAPEIDRRLRTAAAAGAPPPVDRWIVLDMPRTSYYHKHLMYNVGVLASRGTVVMIGDSDAMVTPRFVEAIIAAFADDPAIVLHFDEVRNHSRRHYPFNYPSFDDVLADGCINWNGTTTTGLLEAHDPLHVLNYGACVCARRQDVIAVGGADEHLDYLGHVCGPYELTWRMVNGGWREVWHQHEFLYHVWHPGSDGDENYLGPHDGRNVSVRALGTRRTRTVLPALENRVIRRLREGGGTGDEPLANLIADAIGDRPETVWVVDDFKRAVSAGREAWARGDHARAVAIWEPLRDRLVDDPKFLSDLAFSYYFTGRNGEALDGFDRALALAGDEPDAWRGKGWVLLGAGRYAEAAFAFDQSIARTDLLNRGPRSEALRGRAWARFHQSQHLGAIDDFLVALALMRPGDDGLLIDVHRGLGWSYMRVLRFETAAEHFRLSLAAFGADRGEQYSQVASGLEQAANALREASAALHQVSKWVAAGPRPRTAPALRDARITRLCNLADRYYRAAKFRQARQVFFEALELAPSPRAACGAGWSALRLGRTIQARSAFHLAMNAPAVSPDEKRDACHGLGQIALHERRYPEAARFLELASDAAGRLQAGSANEGEIGRQLARALRATAGAMAP